MSSTEQQGASFAGSGEPDEVTYALGRRPDRTYVSKSFPLTMPPASPDYGEPTRYVHKVFDNASPASRLEDIAEWDIPLSPSGRVQLTLQIVRNAGCVRKLRLQKVSGSGESAKLVPLLELDRSSAMKLIDLIRHLEHIPAVGHTTVRVDDDLIRDLFSDPDALRRIYQRDPTAFRHTVEADVSARDIIAIAHRRQQLAEFRRLLTDPVYFESKRTAIGDVGRERVWQDFLEENPWILGVGLSGHLLTSWSPDRLEQTVAGFSVAGAGKRTDALLRTSGRIRSMVFAEIKHHETKLLQEKSYRTECWPPSEELVGGTVQVQQTVEKASRQIGSRLDEKDIDGNTMPGQYTYLLRPRSFLILGHSDEFYGPGGSFNEPKFRSFELYRRHTQEPEILTFDELLARAEWHVDTAEQSVG
ncbi:Shedu immune nuclease family protein [Dactylosporangium sp. NPDC050688]|uniref:Shedu immune nuclease family protein n=1 Tax=Dactylosporangium sp. NPDC050688 TaxID=3157217 RepID=UPI0033CE9360